MIWKIEVSTKFEKYYKKLSQKERLRIKDKLRELEKLQKSMEIYTDLESKKELNRFLFSGVKKMGTYKIFSLIYF